VHTTQQKNIIQPGRELIKEGTLARVKSKRNEKDFYLFLFNDILLVTTVKEKKKKRGNTVNRSFKHTLEVSLDGVSIMTLTDERASVYSIIMRYRYLILIPRRLASPC
jgi:hypothetical protein